MIRVLLIEDEPLALRAMQKLLARRYPLVPVHTATTLYDALMLGLSNYTIIVTDGNYPLQAGDRPTKQVPRLYELCNHQYQTVIGYVGNVFDVDATTRNRLGDDLVEKPALGEFMRRFDLAVEYHRPGRGSTP